MPRSTAATTPAGRSPSSGPATSRSSPAARSSSSRSARAARCGTRRSWAATSDPRFLRGRKPGQRCRDLCPCAFARPADQATCGWQGGCTIVDVVRWVASIGLLCAGGFYVDPIEPHPTVRLLPASGEVPVVRGGELMVTAVMDHPDTFEWSAVACSDRFGHTCNAMPYPPPPPASQVFKLPVPITVDIAGANLL